MNDSNNNSVVDTGKKVSIGVAILSGILLFILAVPLITFLIVIIYLGFSGNSSSSGGHGNYESECNFEETTVTVVNYDVFGNRKEPSEDEIIAKDISLKDYVLGVVCAENGTCNGNSSKVSTETNTYNFHPEYIKFFMVLVKSSALGGMGLYDSSTKHITVCGSTRCQMWSSYKIGDYTYYYGDSHWAKVTTDEQYAKTNTSGYEYRYFTDEDRKLLESYYDETYGYLYVSDNVSSFSNYKDIGTMGYIGSAPSFFKSLEDKGLNWKEIYNELVKTGTAGSLNVDYGGHKILHLGEYCKSIGGSSSHASKYSKTYWIGDSRACGMWNSINPSEAVSDSQCSNGEIELSYDGNLFTMAGNQGYTWFNNNGLEPLKRTLDDDPNYNVVMAWGINDLGNIDKYISLYEELIGLYPNTNFVFLSVMPVDESKYKSFNNSDIETLFNDKLKSSFGGNYLDSYTYLINNGFEAPGDGVHYSVNTYKDIYEWVINNINGSSGSSSNSYSSSSSSNSGGIWGLLSNLISGGSNSSSGSSGGSNTVVNGLTPMVQWMEEIANDDTHGYCQFPGYPTTEPATTGYCKTGRDFNPDVDCSSFVYYALINAGGFTEDELGTERFSTYSMPTVLTRAGFEKHVYKESELRVGDILLNSHHTEVYYGDGKAVGAVGCISPSGARCDQAGDQGGGEVSVHSNSHKAGYWEYYYRYVGDDPDKKCKVAGSCNGNSSAGGICQVSSSSGNTQVADFKDLGEKAFQSSSPSDPSTKEWIEKVGPIVQKSQWYKYGMKNSLIIAQIIVESGWMHNPVGDNNVIGINYDMGKSIDLQDSNWSTYRKYIEARVTATHNPTTYRIDKMRDYNNLEDCIEDYANLIYLYHPECKGNNNIECYRSFLSGYTDSTVTDKYASIIKNYNLDRFDL